MASDGEAVVNHGLVKRRAGSETQCGTRPSRRCFAKIFGDGPDERIKPDVAGQFRLPLDRRIAIPIGFCQVERVHELGEFDVLR